MAQFQNSVQDCLFSTVYQLQTSPEKDAKQSHVSSKSYFQYISIKQLFCTSLQYGCQGKICPDDNVHLAKCVVFLRWFRGMACVGGSWFSNYGQLLGTDIFPRMTKNCVKISKQAFGGKILGEQAKQRGDKPTFQLVGDTPLG